MLFHHHHHQGTKPNILHHIKVLLSGQRTCRFNAIVVNAFGLQEQKRFPQHWHELVADPEASVLRVLQGVDKMRRAHPDLLLRQTPGVRKDLEPNNGAARPARKNHLSKKKNAKNTGNNCQTDNFSPQLFSLVLCKEAEDGFVDVARNPSPATLCVLHSRAVQYLKTEIGWKTIDTDKLEMKKIFTQVENKLDWYV